MSAAEFWLAFTLAALAAYCIVHFAAWHSASKKPPCRTADDSAMRKQVKQLQAQVPTALHSAPTTASVREARQKQADHVKREAVQAALKDLHRRDKTANPYLLEQSRAHALWALHYTRVSADAAAISANAARHRLRSTNKA